MPRAQPLEKPQASQPGELYEQDFYAWIEEQVGALRSGQTQRLDMENLAEEIEDMGRSQRRAVKSALIIILSHLLKYRYQPNRRTNSWRATIREHRRRGRDELADSPSLRPYSERILDDCYQDAREAAGDESGLPIETFPAAFRLLWSRSLIGIFCRSRTACGSEETHPGATRHPSQEGIFFKEDTNERNRW